MPLEKLIVSIVDHHDYGRALFCLNFLFSLHIWSCLFLSFWICRATIPVENLNDPGYAISKVFEPAFTGPNATC